MITKQEIKDLVYGANFDLALIKDSLIELVKLTNLKPLLGDDLYKDIVDNPSDYTPLLDSYIKPYLAYLVKARLAVSKNLKSGNKGAMRAGGSNEINGGNDGEEKEKRTAASIADDFKTLIIKELDKTKPTLWDGYNDIKDIINNQLFI